MQNRGLVAPGGIPADARKVLEAGLRKYTQSATFKQYVQNNMLSDAWMDGATFGAWLEKEHGTISESPQGHGAGEVGTSGLWTRQPALCPEAVPNRKSEVSRTMKRADQITGFLTLIFSLVLMEGSRRMPPSATFGPGAGFLPFWCGALLALLSVSLIVDAFRRPAASVTKPVFPAGRGWLTLAAVVVGLTAYVLTLEILGFLIGTGLLTAYLLGFVQKVKWTTAIVVALLNAAALYVMFQMLLGVSLPANRFGF